MERLQDVLENLPDEPLIQKLKSIRGKGRNECPVEAMWNSFIANAYTNFLNNLRECQDELREMFDSLVEYMYENLSGLGEILAADGKAIQSYATKISKKNSGNREERDADWCWKTYTTTKPDGEKITKTKKWFGFRLHLISDATYELPVDFEVTKASSSELKETEKLLEKMKENTPEKLDRCNYFLADRGYDSTDLIQRPGSEGISPVIDMRNCWQGEETRQFGDTGLVYNYKGEVYYVPEKRGTDRITVPGIR